MGNVTDIRIRRLLSVVLLAMLLGAQSVQAGHFHADALYAEDCMQCSIDGGHAVSSVAAQSPVVTVLGFDIPPAILSAAFTVHYRRSARGPPSHSC